MGFKKQTLKRDTRGGKTAYLFDSLVDMQYFINETIKKIPTSSRSYSFTNRYYDPTKRRGVVSGNGNFYGEPNADWVDKKIDRYQKITLIDTETRKLTNRASKLEFQDIDQVKQIQFTEREMGIFSFDLASLGLVRVFEYYSPILDAIVDPNMVRSEKANNGQTIYYYVGNPYIPKHEIEYVGSKGGYYSTILKRLVDKDTLIQEEGTDRIVVYYYPEKEEVLRHEVSRKQAKNSDGKPKFATTFKKVFIYIPKIENNLPRVDIIIPISYSGNISAEQSFWNSIAMLSICEKLTKSNVNYRVVGAYGGRTINGRQSLYQFVILKDENQPLDPNQLAIATSDMRYFRIEGFMLDWATQYDSGFENDMDSGVAGTITDRTEIKNAYVEFLSLSNSESDRKSATMLKSKIVLPMAYNEQEALNTYNQVITEISNL